MGVNFSIKGVADDVAERLRRRAESNHRSLQGELMAIIERAAWEPAAGSSAGPTGSDPSRLDTARRGTKTIEQIAAEHRKLYPQPFHDVPRAVDIIREDRDSR